MIEGFDYFRRGSDGFAPRTANKALLALAAGLAPPEAYIHLAASARPLDEEPIDLDEIEGALSREDLDLETNRMLVRLLNRLVRSHDQEMALFAAESINLIEGRYNRRIEELKRRLEAKEDPEDLRRLARQLYELAQLQPGSIRTYHLNECYKHLARLGRLEGLRSVDAALLVRVLLDLKQLDRAASILSRLAGNEDPTFLVLEAELEFRRRDFFKVLSLCTRLYGRQEELQERDRAMLEYWLGD